MLTGNRSFQEAQPLQASHCQTLSSALNSFTALPGPWSEQQQGNIKSLGASTLQPGQAIDCSPFAEARFSQFSSNGIAASLPSGLLNASAATPYSQLASRESASAAAVASPSTEAALQTSSNTPQPASVSSLQGSSRDKAGAGEMPSE